MNANEAVIINRMAERLEEGLAIRGHFNILHGATQQELLARIPYLLQISNNDERFSAIVELQNFCSVEA